MEKYEIIGHDGKKHNARIIKYKSPLVFIVRWNEKESSFNKLIDLQDPSSLSFGLSSS